MSVPIDQVPIDTRRRAARALAALTVEHVSPPGRRKTEPRFGRATPIYRPDLDEVAYWEIEIEGVTSALPGPEGMAGKSDRGFILVATGGHDVPVPHFSLELAPPSQQLERFGEVDRVVKVDALCYAALDARGTLLGHIGTMPPKLTGMPAELPARLPQGSAVTVSPPGSEDGDAAKPIRIRRSKEKRPVKPEPWRSWRELNKGYAASYSHQLAALAERAKPRWETERLTEEFGEGIVSGQTRTVLLLAEGDFALSGPGAGLVKAELNPQPLPPRLQLTARADVNETDTGFEVHLTYAGEEEVLRFFVVPEDAPTLVIPAGGPLGRTQS